MFHSNRVSVSLSLSLFPKSFQESKRKNLFFIFSNFDCLISTLDLGKNLILIVLSRNSRIYIYGFFFFLGIVVYYKIHKKIIAIKYQKIVVKFLFYFHTQQQQQQQTLSNSGYIKNPLPRLSNYLFVYFSFVVWCFAVVFFFSKREYE